MRKNLLISAILSFALLAPVAPIASASQVKVGDKCKKVGRTITSGGSELVCKRDGKKRVWSAVAKTQPSAKPSATQEPATSGITKAQVAANNSPSKCWTIIGNKVYDVTAFISKHPGGKSRIEGLCGIDGTSRFRGQHGSSGGPNMQLDNYYIGDLKG
jgi:cytochrome b involved in lipid metabolism